jgi:hypothetical protein
MSIAPGFEFQTLSRQRRTGNLPRYPYSPVLKPQRSGNTVHLKRQLNFHQYIINNTEITLYGLNNTSFIGCRNYYLS